MKILIMIVLVVLSLLELPSVLCRIGVGCFAPYPESFISELQVSQVLIKTTVFGSNLGYESPQGRDGGTLRQLFYRIQMTTQETRYNIYFFTM